MQRVLVTLLAGHRDGEAVAASAIREVAVRHSISSQAAIEILATMEIVSEDRPGLFTSWLDVRLAGLSPGIAREIRRWATALHDGGPRTQARSPHTARAYLRAALPALRAWSARYDHLREVTRDDVLGYINGLYGHERRGAVAALRSLFTWAKKSSIVFRNPATRIRLGMRELAVWQPLTGSQLADAAVAATTPQARLCLVLAAVHAARPGAIRALRLDDADLGSGRLRLADADRPMGDLTARVLREWLELPAAPLAAHRQPAPAGQQGKRPSPRAGQHRLPRQPAGPARHPGAAADRLPARRGHGHRVRPAAPRRSFRYQRRHRDPLRRQRPPADRSGA